MSHDYNFADTPIYSTAEPHGIISNTYPFQTATNLVILTNIASNLPRAKGTVLSSEFNTSYNGLLWSSGDWDMGAIKPDGGAPPSAPGTIVLYTSTAGAVEGNSIVITARRTGGSDGAVGCSFATSDGTAMDGVNYTATNGIVSWTAGNAADQTVTVATINAGFVGTKTFTFSIATPTGGASIGTPSTVTVTLTGTATATLPGLIWEAEDGQLSAPWTTATVGGVTYAYATAETDPISLAGIAAYHFATTIPGQYRVIGNLSVETAGNNSVWVDIDQPATDPVVSIWDTPVTGLGIWTNVYAGWRGSNGTPFVPEFPGHTWTLASGDHTLYLWSREAACKFDTIGVELFTNPVIQVEAVLTNVSGYFRLLQNRSDCGRSNRILFCRGCHWSANPGSFLWRICALHQWVRDGQSRIPVQFVNPGENSQRLDYSAANALSGTIKSSGLDVDLTLPIPGSVGSLAYNSGVIVDTVSPVTTIAAPTFPLRSMEDQIMC